MSDAPATPFKGLAAFDATDLDALLFFGRERERELIVGNLLASRLTVLYGPSGVGKSSLLRAGVAHRLRQEVGLDGRPEYRVVLFDSWSQDPWAALSAELERTEDTRDRLLLLDQAEEYFLYHEQEEGPGTLVGELPRLVTDPKLRVNVLLAIREDALARLDRFKGSIPSLFSNYLRLDHLDREAARAAILGPVDRYNRLSGTNIQVEDELVTAILDQTAVGRVDFGARGAGRIAGGGVGRVEAPYLQLVLRRLWDVQRAAGSDVLRLSTLDRLGGADAIVRDHLERALAELDPHERDLAASVFRHLVTPSGTKIAHAVGDLAEYAEVDEEELRPVVTRLVEERILRPAGPTRNGADGAAHEIYHDVLGDAVLAWRSRHETEQRLAAERARHRRALRLVAVALVGLLTMTAVAVYAVLQRSDAREAQRRAEARELATRGLVELTEKPRETLRLGLAAAELERTPLTESVLRLGLLGSRLRHVIRLGGPADAVLYMPGGQIVAGRADGVLTLRSPSSGRVFATVTLPGPLVATDVAPDGTILAAGGREVRLRSPDGRGQTLRHRANVTAAVFADHGRLVVSGAADGRARVWDRSGNLLRALRGPRDMHLVAASRAGSRVAVVAADSAGHVKTRLYDARSGRLLRTHPQIGVRTVVFHPSGRLLVAGSADGSLLVAQARDGRKLRTLVSGNGVADTAFSPDGSMLAVADSDNLVRLWNVKTWQLEHQLIGHQAPLDVIAYAPNGKFVVSGGQDSSARVWGARGPDAGSRAGLLAGHTGPVTDIAVSPDSTMVATSSEDGTVRIWDAEIEHHLSAVGRAHGPAIVFARGRAASAPERPEAEAALNRVHSFPSPPRNVTAAAVSPKGDLVATGQADGSIRIFKPNGELLRTLGRHPDAVTDVRFDPAGSRLVSAAEGANENLILWNLTTGSKLVLVGHGTTVTAASFSPDGRWIASAASIAAIIRRIGDPTVVYLYGHTKPSLTDVEWAPTGYRVATTAADGTLRAYTCEFCGSIDALMALARKRLAAAG